MPVDRVGAGYPADNSLIQKHREEKASVFGACALIHLARAVDEKIAQTTVFVTVAGDGVTTSAIWRSPSTRQRENCCGSSVCRTKRPGS